MLADFAAARREPLLAAVSSYRMPSFHVEPTFEPTLEPTLDREPRRPNSQVMLLEPDESMRDVSFDRKTERESRAIAERFAPQCGEAAPAVIEPAEEPALPALPSHCPARNRSTSGLRTASCGVRPRPGRRRS